MAHQQSDQGARDDSRSSVFVAAARLLAYPDEALGALLPEVEAYLRALPASEPVSKK